MTISLCFVYWWSTNISFNRGYSQPMSISSRRLIQCIARHCGIFCRIPAEIIGLLTSMYSGTESAVNCEGGVSIFFPVHKRVRQGCVLAPLLFNSCMDWVLGRVVDQSHCGASVGNTKITDLVFADNAVIFTESLEVRAVLLRHCTRRRNLKDFWSPGLRLRFRCLEAY